ncbi:pseudaminic acid synthase [Halobacteriovorax sp. GFR7]|uniref:pseudaminic acid synthase n=1 Tax=unclassified Halobacteriovorax TaxID=2639665 RepID=UPI00370F8149
MKINNREIGPNNNPYIIAEVSANHNGDIDKAKELIKLAKESGADAVKIQTYTADTMTLDMDTDEFKITGGLWDGYTLYNLYKEAYTPWEWHKELFNYAQKLDITIFSTPFDESAVDFLEELNVPAYKVASFEMTDLVLIDYIAQKMKPIIISTGMSTLEEIKEAHATITKYHNNVVFLHCVSSYPTKAENFNLRMMNTIKEMLNVDIGLSDHSLSNTAAIASVTLGATVIEKHFIKDRSDKGPDSDFSLEPSELRSLCKETKVAWESLGKDDFSNREKESASKKHRRSIYFVNDLKAGDLIKEEDIRRVRPGNGLPPKYFHELIGKRVSKDVSFGEAVKWESIS